MSGVDKDCSTVRFSHELFKSLFSAFMTRDNRFKTFGKLNRALSSLIAGGLPDSGTFSRAKIMEYGMFPKITAN
jgi:hypothetical protein